MVKSVKVWILATVALVALGGCNHYAMKDITIVNANEKMGYDVVAVCDTCKEHGKCGNRDDALIWADQHARSTGHTHFTRQACSMGLTAVLRGPEEHVPPKLTPTTTDTTAGGAWSTDDVLKVGMTIAEARTALGDVGHTESETMGDSVARRTIRFRQVGKSPANVGSARNVSADFENGKLTASKYGAWEK
ncbi:MAG: hypothetical protein JWN40_3146 [Phycisphaerales bacterium]|nr:hypothetical protein [Phycisphaerales bacterium]